MNPGLYDASEFHALVKGMRRDANDTLARMVCADWLQDNGEDERAALIRSMCDPDENKRRKLTGLPFKHTRAWFSSTWHTEEPQTIVPNLANLNGDIVRYYPEDSEGDYTSTVGDGFVRFGFLDHLNCSVTFLLKYFDYLYTRHPITGVTVREWAHEFAGDAVIRRIEDNRAGTFRFLIGGTFAVRITELEIMVRQNPANHSARSRERAVAELCFIKRWPGVSIDVHI